MAGYGDFDIHLSGTLHDGIEILNLEPKQDPVPVRSVLRVGNRPMMMLNFEAV